MIKEDLFNCGKYIKVGGVDILICKYYIDTTVFEELKKISN
jgi:hypothetical protein